MAFKTFNRKAAISYSSVRKLSGKRSPLVPIFKQFWNCKQVVSPSELKDLLGAWHGRKVASLPMERLGNLGVRQREGPDCALWLSLLRVLPGSTLPGTQQGLSIFWLISRLCEARVSGSVMAHCTVFFCNFLQSSKKLIGNVSVLNGYFRF